MKLALLLQAFLVEEVVVEAVEVVRMKVDMAEEEVIGMAVVDLVPMTGMCTVSAVVVQVKCVMEGTWDEEVRIGREPIKCNLNFADD